MKFKLKDRVEIIELGLTGLIVRIDPNEYEVRYFYNVEAKFAWLYEEELRLQ